MRYKQNLPGVLRIYEKTRHPLLIIDTIFRIVVLHVYLIVKLEISKLAIVINSHYVYQRFSSSFSRDGWNYMKLS